MWDLDEYVVRWDSKDLVVALDTKNPTGGVNSISALGSHLIGACILQLHPPQENDGFAAVHEPYARGKDVVASYAATASDAVRSQAYWRYQQFRLEHGLAVGIELIVSVQTNLLDSDPSVLVVTTIRCDEVWGCSDMDRSQFEPLSLVAQRPLDWTAEVARTVHLFRPPDVDVSYVEIVHEQDFRAAQMELSANAPRTIRCKTTLFNERLEKGVIRRGRVWGMFVPRRNDFRSAVACAQQVAAARPPLTT